MKFMIGQLKSLDNDGVPSILGVDFLKHLNATLTYSNAGDACSWVNTEG